MSFRVVTELCEKGNLRDLLRAVKGWLYVSVNVGAFYPWDIHLITVGMNKASGLPKLSSFSNKNAFQ